MFLLSNKSQELASRCCSRFVQNESIEQTMNECRQYKPYKLQAICLTDIDLIFCWMTSVTCKRYRQSDGNRAGGRQQRVHKTVHQQSKLSTISAGTIERLQFVFALRTSGRHDLSQSTCRRRVAIGGRLCIRLLAEAAAAAGGCRLRSGEHWSTAR